MINQLNWCESLCWKYPLPQMFEWIRSIPSSIACIYSVSLMYALIMLQFFQCEHFRSLFCVSVSIILTSCRVCLPSLCFSPWSCVCVKGWSAAVWNGLPDPLLAAASGCSAPEPWLLPGCSSVYDSLVRWGTHVESNMKVLTGITDCRGHSWNMFSLVTKGGAFWRI